MFCVTTHKQIISAKNKEATPSSEVAQESLLVYYLVAVGVTVRVAVGVGVGVTMFTGTFTRSPM
jgi:hypothetical protein